MYLIGRQKLFKGVYRIKVVVIEDILHNLHQNIDLPKMAHLPTICTSSVVDRTTLEHLDLTTQRHRETAKDIPS